MKGVHGFMPPQGMLTIAMPLGLQQHPTTISADIHNLLRLVEDAA